MNKADLQFFYCNFYIGLAIECKPYSEITVESGTQLKTVYICSVNVLIGFAEQITDQWNDTDI